MKLAACLILAMGLAAGQESLRERAPAGASRVMDDGTVLLAAGTRIPLVMMNSISTRNAEPGDQIYLRTMMPVAVEGRIVIPEGTYVTGSVVKSVRPGKVKGKGQLAVRFDSMMLSDGRSIDLTGKLGSLDGDNPGKLDRQEGKVTGPGSEGRDALTVGSTAAAGTMMGGWIGDHGSDAAIGAGAGAAAGLAAVLMTRGPEATLHKGATVDMVLNRDVRMDGTAVGGRPARGRGFQPAPPK
ncbi:MAG: TrbI/VirB10 family protein [Acidobacteria bacterium]|nr:TrbI/VirB10 family protein [Acidobacteriota bacterium]